ncbi:MAG: GDP-mannose 4,6-dehydratase [Chloroflexi bacterium]|nr:GDP-mannose 4,6-dehydratase [Chloroflexota bacterium]
MTKRALITGVAGQDGAYLSSLLLDKGYEVFGCDLSIAPQACWRLKYLGIYDKITLLQADMADAASLQSAVEQSRPHEIYNLAAQSAPGASFQSPVEYGNITGLGFARLLEAVISTDKQIRVYQASTVEIFGYGKIRRLAKDMPVHPANPYAVAKLYAHWLGEVYREDFGLFVCNGIMFNHESPLRGLNFVTRKITNAAARIALGVEGELRLGNLDSRRDWGYAPEYVDAAWRMLQQGKPDDYIIATGQWHSVKEFVVKAFTAAGLDWAKYVKTEAGLLRPVDVPFALGGYSKAKKVLGWQPRVKFDKLVEIMVSEDLARWQRHLKGEIFPWDDDTANVGVGF